MKNSTDSFVLLNSQKICKRIGKKVAQRTGIVYVIFVVAFYMSLPILRSYFVIIISCLTAPTAQTRLKFLKWYFKALDRN